MAVDIDYYAFLGVARDAKAEAIEAAVKKLMREWRKRTEAADLSVRQEAENKVKQIEQARTTLSDAGKRAAYDRALAGGVREAPRTTVDSGNGQSWLDRAEGYLAIGDYHSAAYAAREATQVEGTNARTWWVRSRANAGLKLWQDALYEAKQAVQLEDDSADYHFNLGLVYEEMGRWGDAITEFRSAGACDPSNVMYELAVGGVLLATGRTADAVPIFESVYSRHPQEPIANYYLGMALIDVAESVPRVRDGDTYYVTSAEEIHRMREIALRVKDLHIIDDEVGQAADHILAYLDKMEEKAFRPPRALLAGAFGAAAEAGCLGSVVILMMVVGLILLPVILVFAGFASLGQNAGGGCTMIMIGGGLGFLWYKLSWVPRWKHNKKDVG